MVELSDNSTTGHAHSNESECMENDFIFMKGTNLPPLLIHSLVKWILCFVENRCVVASWDASLPFFPREASYLEKKKVFWSVNFEESHSTHTDCEERKQRGFLL